MTTTVAFLYTTIITDVRCASTFNSYFSSIFTTEDQSELSEVPESNYLYMSPIEVTVEGVARLINNLKLTASCGVDDINSKILKNTVTVSSQILTHIFIQSLETGMLPLDWKIAKVIPIFKSGNKYSPANYRPISLTSICCKMLEHIISSNVYSHLEANKFFFINQHGF